MTNQQIAETILEQLGGNKFRVMTGARNFLAGDKELTFRLPGAGGFTKQGINFVRIKLNAEDTYDLRFIRIRGHIVKEIETVEGIYNDMLQSVFTRVTGLDTHL